jgi:hypothetical protein
MGHMYPIEITGADGIGLGETRASSFDGSSAGFPSARHDSDAAHLRPMLPARPRNSRPPGYRPESCYKNQVSPPAAVPSDNALASVAARSP